MALTVDLFKVPINTDLDLGIMGGQRENCAFDLRTLILGAKYPNVALLKNKQKKNPRKHKKGATFLKRKKTKTGACVRDVATRHVAPRTVQLMR